jgi:hypothetical protein
VPIVSRLARTGLRRGLLEGSRPWLAVGVAAGGMRLLSRLARSHPEVVYTGTLKPGETISISTCPPSGDEGRKPRK